MQRNFKLVLKLITSILVCVVVFFALSISATRLFGLQVYGVLTGSMEPVYPTGSLIYVRQINTDKLEVGDVISFRISSNVIATHRIVEVVPDETTPGLVRYRTKGDANDAVDASLVNKYDIIGKVVFCIPKMGYFMDSIQSPAGIATTVGVSIALVLLVFISEVYTASSKTKTKWTNAIVRRLMGPDAVPQQMQQPRRRPAGQPQRRPAPQQRPRYDDEYRRSRFEEQPRSRFEEDRSPYTPRSRFEELPRRRYEEPPRHYADDYPARTLQRRYSENAPRPQARQPRREDEYCPRRNRFEEQPRSRFEEPPRR